MKKILTAILILLIAVPLCVSAGSRVVLVANTIDYANSGELVRHLDSSGRPVLHITAQELDAHNQERFIIFLGGPDSPEGVGNQVSQFLPDSEQEFLRELRHNKLMFTATNVWRKGQIVVVLAGNTRNGTKTAMLENQAALLSELSEARADTLAQNTENISLRIEGFNYSLNSSNGLWFFNWVEYSMSHDDTASIQPMIDVELQRKSGGEYGQVFLNTNVTHFDSLFRPNDKWIDTHTENVKLIVGKYKLVVRLRDGADSAVVKEDIEEFEI